MSNKKKQNQSTEPVIDNKKFYNYMKSIFYLSADTDEQGTVESISRSIEFKGIGIWTLIFAVFIASLGLNTNSTAVIIGAMLISPLMGPIMGAGLSLGIYDFDLLKKSLRNLSIMTLISIITSFLFFLISPLSDAQSEILARTYPTVYDVLIAIFGGATGIIAGSRKDKISNAIPGVAIATALMPPLCTVGYGIASGNLKYFMGAFYLYIINSFFIGLSTFIFVKLFQFKKKTYIEKSAEKKFHRYILIISIGLIFPSIFMAYDIISQSTFKKNANIYIENNFNFEKSKVINRNYIYTSSKKVIEVTIIGEPLSENMKSHLNLQLENYDLKGADLKIIQYTGMDRINSQDMNSIESVKSKDEKILILQNQLKDLTDKDRLIARAVREVNILFPSIESISFGDLVVHSVKDFSSTKKITVLVKWKYRASVVDRKRLELFLKSRLEAETIQVMDVE